MYQCSLFLRPIMAQPTFPLIPCPPSQTLPPGWSSDGISVTLPIAFYNAARDYQLTLCKNLASAYDKEKEDVKEKYQLLLQEKKELDHKYEKVKLLLLMINTFLRTHLGGWYIGG